MKSGKLLRKIICILSVAAITTTMSSCRKIENDNPGDKFSYETNAELNKGAYNGFNYIVMEDKTVTIKNYRGDSTMPTVPAIIKELPVTAIQDKAFEGNALITSVIIEEGIKAIGDDVFSGCTQLGSIKIPSTVTSIGSRSFSGTPWFEALTDEFAIVGDGVLIDYNSTNENVSIPETVKYISSAFNSNKIIKAVTIPTSTTIIGSFAFTLCTSLETVFIPETITSIGMNAFSKCTSLREVIIPDSVTEIGKKAFLFCTSLERVTVSASIKAINEEVFEACTALREITIPQSVETIASQAFMKCTSLVSAVIPPSVTDIDAASFAGCNKNLVITCEKGSFADTFFTTSSYKVKY